MLRNKSATLRSREKWNPTRVVEIEPPKQEEISEPKVEQETSLVLKEMFRKEIRKELMSILRDVGLFENKDIQSSFRDAFISDITPNEFAPDKPVQEKETTRENWPCYFFNCAKMTDGCKTILSNGTLEIHCELPEIESADLDDVILYPFGDNKISYFDFPPSINFEVYQKCPLLHKFIVSGKVSKGDDDVVSIVFNLRETKNLPVPAIFYAKLSR